MTPLGGRADHPAKWVLLKEDDRARRFITRHGPLFQDNKGAHLADVTTRDSPAFVQRTSMRPSHDWSSV